MKQLYFILLLFACLNGLANARHLEFSHVTLPSTISSKSVNSIVEDDRGFIWIGLSSGLIRYDGYQAVQLYKGRVNALAKDLDGNIWIAAFSRLLKYDYTANQFEPVGFSTQQFKIGCVQISHEGDVMVGTRKGLFVLDARTYKIKQTYNELKGLSNNSVRAIYEGKNGVIWIGTEDKLNKLDRKTGKVTQYEIKDTFLKNNNLILDILPFKEGDDSKLWVATETGLALFNTRTGTFKKYHHGADASMLSNDVVKKLCRVSDNEIWIGTDRGLNIFNVQQQQFQHYFADFNNHFSISNDVVSVVFKSSKGTVWLGTDNGVDKISFLDGAFVNNTFSGSNEFLPNGMTVNNFAFDGSGNVWLATNEGLVEYNKSIDSYMYYNMPQILHSKVKDVLVDRNKKVWIATSGGLNVFDPETRKFHAYVAEKKNPKALQTDFLSCIAESPNGQIWIGTVLKGIYKVDQLPNHKLEFTNFKHNPKNKNSLSGNYINGIVFKGSESPWVATGRRLDSVNPKSGHIKHFTKEKLDYTTISTVITDEKGGLWCSSGEEILKLNVDKGILEPVLLTSSVIKTFFVDKSNIWYTTRDRLNRYNLESKETVTFFSQSTGIRDFISKSLAHKNDSYYLGGDRGFVSFNPDYVNVESQSDQVQLTAFKVLNKEIKPNEKLNNRILFDKNLNDVEEIVLTFEENSFSIHFSSLDFNVDKTHHYQVKLDGLEDEWQTVDASLNFMTYTKVKPGKYSFMVKSSNDFGKFEETYTSIHITVLPPWWATWWFRTLVVALVCSSVLGYYKQRTHALKKRQRELEHQVNERTNDLLQQAEELSQQAEELEAQRDHLDQKNKVISQINEKVTASISYAQTIQKALLSFDNLLEKDFADRFLIYRPKDIVSGDFYWMSEQEDKVFLAVIDCTGHGVPGAFMSMIGNALLNRVVNERKEYLPERILTALDKELKIALKQEQKMNDDGMDMVFCTFVKNNSGKIREVYFSGAKNDLYIFEKKQQELRIIKGDKKPIGGSIVNDKKFSTQHLSLNEGDMLYLITDGVLDQNRMDRKRFGKTRFIELIEKISLEAENMASQKSYIENELNAFQGDEEQRDDITLVGVKV